MDTEQEIIYTMLETLRGGELNNDEPLGERLLRNLLRKHRPESIRKMYRNGIAVDPEVFQHLQLTFEPVITSTGPSETDYQIDFPKLIRLPKDTGFYIEQNGYMIPLVNPGVFYAERRNFNTKFQIKGKLSGSNCQIYIGDKDSKHIELNSEMWTLIKSLEDNIQENGGNLIIDFYGVLLNPSDDPNYNWKTDVYPFPSERIAELCNTIYAKEFGIIVQAKSDEVQNTAPDQIRYHDRDDVNQG